MSGYAVKTVSPEGEAAIVEPKISPLPSRSTYIALIPSAAHIPAPLKLSDRPVTVPALILAPQHDRHFIPYLRRARPGFHAALDNLTIQGYYSDEEEEENAGWISQEDVEIRWHDDVEDEIRHKQLQHTQIQTLHSVEDISEEDVQIQEPKAIGEPILHKPQEGVEEGSHCAVEGSVSYEENKPKGTDDLYERVSSTPLPARRLRSVRRQVIKRGEASRETEPVEGTEAFHRKYPNIPHHSSLSPPPPPATLQARMEQLRRIPSPLGPSPKRQDYSGNGHLTLRNTTLSMYCTLTALGAHPDAITPIVKREGTMRVKIKKKEGEGKGVWGWMSDFWWKKPKDNHKGKGKKT